MGSSNGKAGPGISQLVAVPLSERPHVAYPIHDVTKRVMMSILHYDVTFHGALVVISKGDPASSKSSKKTLMNWVR